MTTYVFRWPPGLGHRNQRITVEDPVRRSRSLLTGARYVSAHARRRRLVELEVSIRANHGYGLMEGLIEALEGGEHLVRLSLAGPTDVRIQRYAAAFAWSTGYAWESGYEWSGRIVAEPFDGPPPGVNLSGLTPSRTVARAGEFISGGGVTRRLLNHVVADASGEAVAYLDEPFPSGFAEPIAYGGAFSSGFSSGFTVAEETESGGYVALGAEQSAIFEVVEIPEVPWTFNAEGSVNWRFREVHEDEVFGALVELSPWGTS